MLHKSAFNKFSLPEGRQLIDVMKPMYHFLWITMAISRLRRAKSRSRAADALFGAV
jgi:hypothetical protein